MYSIDKTHMNNNRTNSYEFHIPTPHTNVNCACMHLNWTCFILSSFQLCWFHGGSISGVPSFYPVLTGRSEESLECLPLAARSEIYQARMIGLENDLLSNCMHDQKYSQRTGLLTPKARITCVYRNQIIMYSQRKFGCQSSELRSYKNERE